MDIDDNYVADNNAADSTTYADRVGIHINCADARLKDNVVTDTGAGTQDFGVAVDSGAVAPIFVRDNDVRGNVVAGISDRDQGRAIRTGNTPAIENAFDAAPVADAEFVGQPYLAGPLWDPDGDGNGEWVVYDGSAYQEMVDLPNY